MSSSGSDDDAKSPTAGGDDLLRDGVNGTSYLLFEGCQTMECCVGKAAELVFATSWKVFSDPLVFGQEIWDNATAWLVSHVALLSWALGAFLLFSFSNLAIFSMRKFAKICEAIKKALVLMMHLPIVEFFLGILRRLLQLVFKTAIENKGERERLRQDNKELRETLDKLTIMVKKIGEGATRAKREATAEAENWGRQVQDRLDRRRPEPQAGPSNHGGQGRPPPGGQGSQGGDRNGPRRNNRWSWRPNNTPPRMHPIREDETEGQATPNGEAARTNEPIPSTSAGVSAVLPKDQNAGKLLYTPAFIDGVRFSRCLIDTGAEVNLVPKASVVKYGFSFDKSGIKMLSGFDGTKSAVDGAFSGTLKIGPAKHDDVEFLISSSISIPIIGLPTLSALGISVDCGAGELTEKSTGHTVQCSVVFSQKN